MKTNVVLKSEDRMLFNHKIRQQSANGFLNISDLQEAYTQERIKNGWVEKRADQILSYEENKERIYYVLKEQGFINVSLLTFMENASENYMKYLKEIGAYKTTGARHTKTSWANPYIWMLVALELNPIFYAKTIIWLTDNLIINRIDAGNFCKALNHSVQKFNPNGNDYMTLAKALNHIVFGRHEAGIRNTGTKEQLKNLQA